MRQRAAHCSGDRLSNKELDSSPLENWGREECLWRMGLVLIALVILIYGLSLLGWIPLKQLARPCLLHSAFGWYCPGCGGTRAVVAFFQGRFLTSFYDYPMVPYVLGLFFWFMVSHTLRHLTRGRVQGLRYRDWYLTVALILFFLGWLGKNVFYAFGISLIK